MNVSEYIASAEVFFAKNGEIPLIFTPLGFACAFFVLMGLLIGIPLLIYAGKSEGNPKKEKSEKAEKVKEKKAEKEEKAKEKKAKKEKKLSSREEKEAEKARLEALSSQSDGEPIRITVTVPEIKPTREEPPVPEVTREEMEPVILSTITDFARTPEADEVDSEEALLIPEEDVEETVTAQLCEKTAAFLRTSMYAGEKAEEEALDLPEAVEEPQPEPLPEEPALAADPVLEEPAVEVFVDADEALIIPDEEDVTDASEEENAEDGSESAEAEDPAIDGNTEESADSPFGFQQKFIDVKKDPEAYMELLEQERLGKIRIVSQYKKDYTARLASAPENVRDYYAQIKHALLSYKGMKSRESVSAETFKCDGKTQVAKINVKASTLFLYLAFKPEEMEGTRYGTVDVSSKKKFASVPTLLKIKGDRKFKYAIELIDRLCAESLQLPKAKKDPGDFSVVPMTDEQLAESGHAKLLAAGVKPE